MVVIAAIDGIAAHVVQRVVHPAHVPLHREAKAANACRPGYAWPRGGLLGDGDDAGRCLVRGGVHLLQELHRFQVLPAAVDVRAPAALGTRIVQVEHRCHRVHPQAVDVELLEPVQRVGHQEVAHLGSAEVEYVSAPVQLLAALGIGVFVERGAVEAAQRPGVLGKVRRHPVDDDADAGPVQRVDQSPELVGRAEARCRRVVGRDLVPPRSAERVLGYRQQFDVGKALCHNVIGQFARQVGGSSVPGATSRGGPRRCSSARTPGCASRARPSSRRRPRCSRSRSPATRSAAAPRCRTRTGRPGR